MIKVLCIHQGAEKYGSDKSFVAAVSAINRSIESDTKVLLPEFGPISELLNDANLTNVSVRHLWILRKSGFIKSMTIGLPRNIWAAINAYKDLGKYDLVYVNTCVIIDYLLASILSRRRIVVHVREIPTGIAMLIIRILLTLSNSKIIFNSKGTQTAFSLPKFKEQAVVYNGFTPPNDFTKPTRNPHRAIQILCIGRINAWKGQKVLINALALLTEHQRKNLKVRIVGGVYKDQTHFKRSLVDQIEICGLDDIVEMVEFANDPSPEYIAADILVVPSVLPEPFGRVAIEGMAFEAAVIASDHGGLCEIVVNKETGWLVEPRSARALADAILEAVSNPDIIEIYGRNGRKRFLDHFTQAAADRELIKALRNDA